jgi:hypothetical protein
MVADVISQLEQRDGLLPLSIEDRPRLAALLAAYPTMTAMIREAHVLASRTVPSADSVRLHVTRYQDEWEAGDHLVFEMWAPAARADAAWQEFRVLIERWVEAHSDGITEPFTFSILSRKR